ncbi:MAG: DUF3320 domain-containing protein [Planctomycetota bacterium]
MSTYPLTKRVREVLSPADSLWVSLALLAARRFELSALLAQEEIERTHEPELSALDPDARANRLRELVRDQVSCLPRHGDRFDRLLRLEGPERTEACLQHLRGFSGADGERLRSPQILEGVRWLGESGALGDVLSELTALAIGPQDLDEPGFAASLRSVLDQLLGGIEDRSVRDAWQRFHGVAESDLRVASESSDANRLAVKLEYDRRLNWAMERNGVPIVHQVRLTNRASEVLEHLTLSLQAGPGFGPRYEVEIPAIAEEATYTLRRPNLVLDERRLRTAIEREKGQLQLEVRSGAKILVRESWPIELLAYNEWDRSALPELLSAFVLPNHPSVSQIMETVRDCLESATGDPTLAGYHDRSRLRVRQVTEAVYAALQELEITYVVPPASFEASGQKIRLPDEILEHRMGTCLDLTVLIAACLEHAGLHPILVLVEGHAFPGCWALEDWLPVPATDDHHMIRKLVDAGELVIFDSSTLTQRPRSEFDTAAKEARRRLVDPAQFESVIDVRAARLAKVLPLPFHIDAPPLPAAPLPVASPATLARPPREIPEAAPAPMPAPMPEPEAPTPEPQESPASRIERWKERLLDLSLRNRLLNYSPSRGKTVQLAIPELALLEDLLSAGGALRFEPRIDVAEDPRAQELQDARGASDHFAQQRRSLLERGRVLTAHEAKELERRLSEIARQARTEVEESGASTLYLAIGLLQWYESDTSDKERTAPILLYPVELIRGSAREPYRLKMRDDEPRLNDTLFEKLRITFGLEFEELRTLPLDDSGVDVEEVLQTLRRAVARLPRFDVRDEAHLSFFSFTKYLMWLDLDQHRAALMRNALVEHLVSGGQQPWPEQDPFPEPRSLDRGDPPCRVPLVLDADSSQLAAVQAGVSGRTFVLQGPPGTGKSQTIANLIAACLSAGQRVLFVAEKRAALDVVARRLSKVGLGDDCLELHSNKANKRAVVEELARVLESKRSRGDIDLASLQKRSESAAARLNDYVDSLHEEAPVGRSYFQAAARLGELEDTPQVTLQLQDIAQTTKATFEACLESLAALADAARDLPQLTAHPFSACRVTSWSRLEAREHEVALARALAAAKALQAAQGNASRALGLPLELPLSALDAILWLLRLLERGVPEGASSLLKRSDRRAALARLEGLLEPAEKRQALIDRISQHFEPRIIDAEPNAWLAAFRRHVGSMALLRWWGLRKARAELAAYRVRPHRSARETLEDLERVIEAQELGRALEREQSFLAEVLGANARGAATDFALVGHVVAFVRDWGEATSQLEASIGSHPLQTPPGLEPGAARSVLEPLSAALTPFRTELAEIVRRLSVDREVAFRGPGGVETLGVVSERLESWRASLPMLRDWARFIGAEDRVREAGLAEIGRALRQGELRPAELGDAYERAFWESWLDHRAQEIESLRSFNGRDHDRVVSRFQRTDHDLVEAGGEAIAASLAKHRPELLGEAVAGSEVGILLREARKKRRHLSVRRLLEQVPHLLPRLKPCLLMSPLSIAQYLPASREPFDVVIFDEASQIPTQDAVGAIARGRQVIVVGDSKQLPPTSFFSVDLSESEESESTDDFFVQELESILDECMASGLPSCMLQWHYRSRDERLITFSNWKYYGNRLHTFPAPGGAARQLGVTMEWVDGQFARGRTRTNRAEAEAVASWVVESLRDPERSHRSIGVVTFNQSQQTLIEDLLETARRKHPEIEPFFDERAPEPVFVKNLENVQGDERDVILFSITYGPDANGKVSMNFGPLNRAGGERRLNVAITRAREHLRVFSTLRPEQIDLNRTRAVGAEHLKDFLRFAAEGPSALAELMVATPEAAGLTTLEKEIASRLEERGYAVDLAVGCAGFRIDIGVKDPSDPDEYLMAIVSDGSSYRSAPMARDRDRIRQSVLENLGWAVHRVWSLDWWHDPDHELERIEKAIQKAKRSHGPGTRGANLELTLHLDEILAKKADEESPEIVEPEAAEVEEPKAEHAEAEPRGESSKTTTTQEEEGDGETGEVGDEDEEPDRTPEGALIWRTVEEKVLGDPDWLEQDDHAPELLERIIEIVEVEGPVHRRRVMRSLMVSLEISRSTSKVQQRVTELVERAENENRLSLLGDFLWSKETDPGLWDDFRGADAKGKTRAPELIPAEELAAAQLRVLKGAISVPREDLFKAAGQLLGFKRTTEKLKQAMPRGLGLLLERKQAVEEGDRIRLP